MMFITNRVFIDTSILIEAVKGNKVRLYQQLVSDNSIECCINETIISEYLFYILAFFGGASPLTIKEKKSISRIIENNKSVSLILSEFTLLPSYPAATVLVPELMAKYNLLPNDAIMIATCKLHDIKKLASHDTDFSIPCKEEGIELLTEI